MIDSNNVKRPLSNLPLEIPSSSSRLNMYFKTELLVLRFVLVVIVFLLFFFFTSKDQSIHVSAAINGTLAVQGFVHKDKETLTF